MEPTALESAESWATIVAACTTAAILFVGAIAAFWKFIWQQPFGNHWSVDITTCRARRVNNRWVYVVTVTVENRSAARHSMDGWWRRLRFPDEVDSDYDPNASLQIYSAEEARRHFGTNSMIESEYRLASGERYSDQMICFRDGELQQVCYLEYTLKYRKGVWGSAEECISQIMVSPVEREDLI